MSLDPVELTKALVRCPSVTPKDEGAQDVLAEALAGAGFSVTRLTFAAEGTVPVQNLVASVGGGDGPHLAFNGHTDVVPPGPRDAWTRDPFSGAVRDGRLYGRGACDMKSGVAAFAAAAARHVERHGPPPGILSLMITGDEEGPAVNGSRRLLVWALDNGMRPDACLVGEPTSLECFGDTLKIGRRGSLSGRLRAIGRQGHVGYPDRADNAAHRIVRLLTALIEAPLDEGSQHFDPSTLQATTIDVGNPTHNVVPGTATAHFNVRFNDLWDAAGLEATLRERLDRVGGYDLDTDCSAMCFLTEPGPFSAAVAAAVEAVAGAPPTFSTTGGTSDARFFAPVCPVVEFGLIGDTMHQADEGVAVEGIEALAEVYAGVIERFFGRTA